MTIADRVKDQFEHSKKTTSIPKEARKIDPNFLVDDMKEYKVYYFFDKSKLFTKGRGKNYQIWTN